MSDAKPDGSPPHPVEPGFPRAEFDGSLALLREGYDFGRRRFEALGSDVFETRIALSKAVFMRGAAAAELFYDPAARFTRKGALPQTTLRLLQDKGSVLWLDDAHRHRKALFLRILTDAAQVRRLLALFDEEWRRAVPEWAARGEVTFLPEASLAVARAAARWAGFEGEQTELDRLGRALFAMSDNAARIGPRAWAALVRRRLTERRIRRRLAALRRDMSALAPDAPIRAVLDHRDVAGRPLDLETATVEVINLLRPTVAVARYMTWAAIALKEHPGWRERFAAGD